MSEQTIHLPSIKTERADSSILISIHDTFICVRSKSKVKSLYFNLKIEGYLSLPYKPVFQISEKLKESLTQFSDSTIYLLYQSDMVSNIITVIMS